MLIVFGSINMDLSLAVDHHPAPGETLLASAYDISGGGKGANQAFAAARAGAKTALVGCVGDDMLGHRALRALKKNGVMTSGVVKSEQPTGLASIAVTPDGENTIIVAAGANSGISHEQVPDEILTEKNLLLLQNEVPSSQTIALAKRAKDSAIKAILNFAPFHTDTLPILQYIDLLIMNETEAQQTAQGLDIMPKESTPHEIAAALSAQKNMDVIVTLGKDGSFAATTTGATIEVPALPLETEDITDTTGAGDAYCGTLAAALHAGASLEDAMKAASVAGSLACTKKGAQSSYPYLGDIEEALKTLAPQAT